MTCQIHDLSKTSPGHVFHKSCISQVMDFTKKHMYFAAADQHSTLLGTDLAENAQSIAAAMHAKDQHAYHNVTSLQVQTTT